MVVGLVSLAPFILAAATAATPQPVTHVHALVVHPDHDTLLAGTHSGLFRSRDAGVTWERVSPQGDLATGDVIALAMHPQAYDQLYAAGHDLGVWRSHDFGQTWQRSDQGLPAADVTALAVDPHKSTQLYAWVVGHDLYRSQDSGHAWQRIADGPDNPQVQSLASVNIPTGMGGIFIYAGTAAGVFRSPD
jgi:photosystem II stability/assembly factor-like uncharacterized protein